jgi:phage recombination protein Bet
MGQLISITDRFSSPQVALIQRMNQDCSPSEFDQFMHVSATLGLDPLKKQIYAFVFNKDNADKRRMSIVVGIDGFRAVAKRSGEYRGDERAPRFVIDPELVSAERNPLGLVSAEVTVNQFSHGAWHPITAIVFWDEFAPIVEGGKWEKNENGKSFFRGNGSFVLDPKKDNWRKMPRVMLAKCAEAQAIRRGWPEDLSAVYSDEEMDRATTIDLTATEIAEAANVERRLELIGGKDTIMFDMGEGLERIPLGKAADMVIERLGKMQPHEVMQWENVNRLPLQEFWSRAKSDALEVKKFVEAIRKTAEP